MSNTFTSDVWKILWDLSPPTGIRASGPGFPALSCVLQAPVAGSPGTPGVTFVSTAGDGGGISFEIAYASPGPTMTAKTLARASVLGRANPWDLLAALVTPQSTKFSGRLIETFPSAPSDHATSWIGLQFGMSGASVTVTWNTGAVANLVIHSDGTLDVSTQVTSYMPAGVLMPNVSLFEAAALAGVSIPVIVGVICQASGIAWSAV
jgi:hypothetical protein